MKSTVLIVFFCLLYAGVSAQTSDKILPEKLILTKENSIQPGEEKIIEATGAIRFTSGFKSKGVLRTSILNRRSSLGTKRPGNSCFAFPNPGHDVIKINGTFNLLDLGIFDRSGNLIVEKMITGENPTVDISCLTEGEYILKSQHFTIRLLKK